MDLVTQVEAAKRLGVPCSTIGYWRAKGWLPYQKSGGTIIINGSDLVEANRQSRLHHQRNRPKAS